MQMLEENGSDDAATTKQHLSMPKYKPTTSNHTTPTTINSQPKGNRRLPTLTPQTKHPSYTQQQG